MINDFSWADPFNDDARPEQPLRASIESLSDGDYDFTIIDANFAQVGHRNILRLGLRSSQGSVVEWLHWLHQQSGINSLLADLLLLGFPADQWGAPPKIPLSQAFPKVEKALPGISFRARKTTRQGRASIPGATPPTYHNLYIAYRLKGPVPNTAAPATPPSVTSERDIPF